MDYYTLTNKIKGHFTRDWLTPSQSFVFDEIENKYDSQKFINVYGSPGVGKTFLAWNFEKELGAKYIKSLSEIESSSVLVIDDYQHARRSIRDLIQEVFFHDVNKVIILTEKKAEDDITKIELSLVEDDKSKFKNNLWKEFNFNFRNEKSEYDLNSLIKNNLL